MLLRKGRNKSRLGEIGDLMAALALRLGDGIHVAAMGSLVDGGVLRRFDRALPNLPLVRTFIFGPHFVIHGNITAPLTLEGVDVNVRLRHLELFILSGKIIVEYLAAVETARILLTNIRSDVGVGVHFDVVRRR